MLAKSAAFIEDIPIEEGVTGANFTEALTSGFKQAATNCFGAVALYGGCLFFCFRKKHTYFWRYWGYTE